MVYGSGEVARRATSLGPKPSLFVFFCVLSFLAFNRKTCFSPEKVSLCFSLAFFGIPLFHFLFLCLSLFLFFLPSCLYFCFLFVSCFCLFLSFYFFFAFVSWKAQHQHNQLHIFLVNPFSFLLLSSPLFSFKSSFLIFVIFPDFKLCFFVEHQCFLLKMQVWKTPILGQEGLQHNGFVLTCVLQYMKGYRFLHLCHFLFIFKKHCKNRYFSTFFKSTKLQKNHFEGLLSGPSRGYYLVQVGCVFC